MTTPISSDKFLTQRDAIPSRSENSRSQNSDRDRLQTQNVDQDTLRLNETQYDGEVRPPSEEIRSADQAQNRLQNLLESLRASPQDALAAQAGVTEARVGALLNSSN